MRLTMGGERNGVMGHNVCVTKPQIQAARRHPDPDDGGVGVVSTAAGYGVVCASGGRPREKVRRQRRFLAVGAAVLGMAGIIGLFGFVVDWSSGGGAGGGLGHISGGRAALLQQGLDMYDGDDDGDDDLRDEMLAAGAPAGREQALSWLDWNEEDIENELTKIKQKLIKVEQAYIAQPQKLDEMKVAMGNVQEYYGPNGKLRNGVPESLDSARLQLQQAEDEVMQSERMRKLTADIHEIRSGAQLFVEAQRKKDDTQDSLLKWNTDAMKKFQGHSYEHLKMLKRHLRGDWRDVSKYNQDVKNYIGDNRRRITRGVRRKKEEIEAKGKELMVKFFGKGSKRMRGKTRGRKRQDGLWDAIEDEANANVSKGLAAAFGKWDATMRDADASMGGVEHGLGVLEPTMKAWEWNVSWRLGNLSASLIDFKMVHGNLTLPLNASAREQWAAVSALQDAIDDMAERRAVAMDPCIGARETAQALSVLIALLTHRADTAQFDDLEGQKRLDAVRDAFYRLESRRLSDEERHKMFKVLLGVAARKNSTAVEVEAMTEVEYRAAVARINKEQQGVLDERALILMILKLLSQQDYSKAEEKIRKLSRLKGVGAEMQSLFQRRYEGDAGSEQGRGRRRTVLEGEDGARGGGGEGEAEEEGIDPDIYTKVDGRYKYGVNLQDTEEIRVVKGILLKILLQLDDQERNMQAQLDLWEKIVADGQAARIKWETTLLDSMHKDADLSSKVKELQGRVESVRSEFDYRKESFNETHSAFVLQAQILDEEITALRRALARAQEKVETCDLERTLNGGKETPHAVEASAKAEAAWKVLLGRLMKHNATAKFIHDISPPAPPPDTPPTGAAAAAAAAARGGHARLRGEGEGAANGRAMAEVARDKILHSLNKALRKLKEDEDAERKLKSVVSSGRDRLGQLHRELVQATMMQQLASGMPLKHALGLARHSRGRAGANEMYEVDRFQHAAQEPVQAYRKDVRGLDAQIAQLSRLAAQKRAQQGWGQAQWVGPLPKRPHWN